MISRRLGKSGCVLIAALCTAAVGSAQSGNATPGTSDSTSPDAAAPAISAVSDSAASKSTVPRLTPLPIAVELGLSPEPLPLAKIIEAALLFSGVPEEFLGSYEERFEALAGEIGGKSDGGDAGAAGGEAADGGGAEAAEDVLTYMHEKLLRRYEEPQSRLDVLLDTGSYNCVSSAVVYLILGRSLGLVVEGVKTRDHAFCLVAVDGESFDVETTNRFGFNPGEKKEFHDAFGNVTGFSYVPPTSYGSRTRIGEKGLIALILQNRGSLESARRRYADAVGPAVDAFFLLRDEDSYAKMVSALLNLSSACAIEERFEDAVDFLDHAVSAVAAAYDLEESSGAAVGTILRVSERLAEDSRIGRQRSDILDNWIVTLFREERWASAETLIEEQFEVGRLSRSKRTKYLVYVYQVRAQEISRGGRYLQALRSIEQAIAVVGPDENLLRSLSVYRRNFEAKAHNEMVEAYQADRYEEAKRILEAALQQLPDSDDLKKDLETLEKALESRP